MVKGSGGSEGFIYRVGFIEGLVGGGKDRFESLGVGIEDFNIL